MATLLEEVYRQERAEALAARKEQLSRGLVMDLEYDRMLREAKAENPR